MNRSSCSSVVESEFDLNLGDETRSFVASQVQSHLSSTIFDQFEHQSWTIVEEYFPKFLVSDTLKNFLGKRKEKRTWKK
jgi:hypothetical protein